MTVAVLMSTYNSSKFIEQQIDSILNQTTKNVKLYIVDDGSTDNTIDIIKYYRNNFSNIIFLNTKEIHSSPLKSFMWLLKNVESDYYLFSDHDDIWLENKIELSLNKIKEIEKKYTNKPILVHTDLIVVDLNLKIINNSFWTLSKINPKLLNTFNYLAISNGVVGCTMIFNHLAKKSILPINEYTLMHDSWITLCILNNDGIVEHIEFPTVYYRQHNDNVIGFVKPNKIFSLITWTKIFSIIRNNYFRFKMVNQIRKFTFLQYMYYKIIYLLK
jgi:glycosyltransferase involved in cell wall biosynthesis